jgi:hypothetical protein
MWARTGSTQTDEWPAHASVRAFSCPLLAHIAVTHVDPSSTPLLCASLPPLLRPCLARRQRELMRVAICVGHQCPDAFMTALGGKRPVLGLYIPGHVVPLPPHRLRTVATMTGRWPFSMTRRWPFCKKTKNNHEASGSASQSRRRMPPPSLPCMTPMPAMPSPPVPPRWSTSRLYARGQPVPWPEVNMPARWHLNSCRVPVPPVPLEGPERIHKVVCPAPYAPAV